MPAVDPSRTIGIRVAKSVEAPEPCASNSAKSKAQARPLCPSYRCDEKASLIGIVNELGQVEFLGVPLLVTAAFVEQAARGRPAESRYRFAGRCGEGSCKNWSGEHCEVAAEAAAKLDVDPHAQLPVCGIRAECRWYSQAGSDACRGCSLIVRGV